jgi:hypothetical protein
VQDCRGAPRPQRFGVAKIAGGFVTDAYRWGSWAAGGVSLIGVAYIVALAFGFARFGLDQPIADPVLAVMEVLTLLSAPLMVVTMAAVHSYASADRKFFGVLALSFTILFAGTTSVVHFVELTAGRQLGTAEIAWPSTVYAVELLAWDWFLGLALWMAGFVFPGSGRERLLRRGLWLSGLLALLGTVGPMVGDMRLQRIGILGYAGLLPVVFLLLARFLWQKK